MQPDSIRRGRPSGGWRDHSQHDTVTSCTRSLHKRICAKRKSESLLRDENILAKQNDVARAIGRAGGKAEIDDAIADAIDGQPSLIRGRSKWRKQIFGGWQDGWERIISRDQIFQLRSRVHKGIRQFFDCRIVGIGNINITRPIHRRASGIAQARRDQCSYIIIGRCPLFDRAVVGV